MASTVEQRQKSWDLSRAEHHAATAAPAAAPAPATTANAAPAAAPDEAAAAAAHADDDDTAIGRPTADVQQALALGLKALAAQDADTEEEEELSATAATNGSEANAYDPVTDFPLGNERTALAGLHASLTMRGWGDDRV